MKTRRFFGSFFLALLLVGLLAVPAEAARVTDPDVEAKAALIKKALAVESLPVEADAEKVSFPWFADGQDGDSAKAYTHFITALCDMARKQKRVTAKERPADHEKYAFRCFLLRLGFIGEEYKGERKVLLKNLSGNGSFKSGARKGAADNDISE